MDRGHHPGVFFLFSSRLGCRGSLAVSAVLTLLLDRLGAGFAISGRDLGIMSWTARVGFSKFTDEEIGDIHAYLLDYRKGPPNIPTPAP